MKTKLNFMQHELIKLDNMLREHNPANSKRYDDGDPDCLNRQLAQLDVSNWTEGHKLWITWSTHLRLMNNGPWALIIYKHWVNRVEQMVAKKHGYDDIQALWRVYYYVDYPKSWVWRHYKAHGFGSIVNMKHVLVRHSDNLLDYCSLPSYHTVTGKVFANFFNINELAAHFVSQGSQLEPRVIEAMAQLHTDGEELDYSLIDKHLNRIEL
jgi:hypothetical protein